MKTLKINGVNIALYPTTYTKNQRPALMGIVMSEEAAKANVPVNLCTADSIVISTNLPDTPMLYENEIFVDENNHPRAAIALVNAGVASYTENIGFSGYCVYPSVALDMEAIKEYTPMTYEDEEEDMIDYDEDFDA